MSIISLSRLLFESVDSLEKIRNISTDSNKNVLEKAKEIYNFATQNYTMIGHGSNRSVFDIGGNRALKVSYVPKNLSAAFRIEDAQSQTENEAEVCSFAKEKGLVPEIYEIGPDGLFLVVKKAEKITKNELAGYFGFNSFDDFKTAYRHAYETGAGLTPDSIFSDWIAVMKMCNYTVGDMLNIDNWGKIGDRLVMVDTGLSLENVGSISNYQKNYAAAVAAAIQQAQRLLVQEPPSESSPDIIQPDTIKYKK
jgi:hypothetical protein